MRGNQSAHFSSSLNNCRERSPRDRAASSRIVGSRFPLPHCSTGTRLTARSARLVPRSTSRLFRLLSFFVRRAVLAAYADRAAPHHGGARTHFQRTQICADHFLRVGRSCAALYKGECSMCTLSFARFGSNLRNLPLFPSLAARIRFSLLRPLSPLTWGK